MNIKIIRLELNNFKCFRHKEFSFDQNITVIRGRNGVGKTTIADAILWCLFGKNSTGQTNFSIKTHDEKGNDIPHLDHSVELVLETSDPDDATFEITLKRTLKETWIKKRGASEETLKGHTTEYFVNGNSYTAKDYEKYISELVNEDIFRAITNPAYFPSLKWQTQREFLAKMVGEITEDDFTKYGDDSEMYQFRQMLAQSNEDVIAYRKHLSYQIKQVKDKLDKIPVRLEEQNKALPEKLDWDALKMDMDKAKQELAEVDKNILAIRSGNADEVKRADIRKQLQEHSRSLSAIESRTRELIAAKENQKNQAVAEASRKFNSLVTSQRDLEQAITSFESCKKRCLETLDQCEREAQQIRDEWAQNLSRTLNFTDSECFCPTCGQYLPEELVAEKRKKAEENLNTDKARIKSELTQRAERVKATRSEAEKMIAGYDQKKTEAENGLADIKEQINQVFSEKAKLEKEQVPTYTELLAQDEEYQRLLAYGKTLNDAMDATYTGDDEVIKQQLEDLSQQKQTISEEVLSISSHLSTKSQYDYIQDLIQGINNEQKELIAQLSELEKKEDIASRYQDRQNDILEQRINQHFSLVRWKMFRTINNGGDSFQEPYCECYSPDGSAYHDGANQAMRLNMGLDIINTLCKHYDVSAPIILDNAESTINILDTIGQQIRLSVNDSDLQTI